MALILFDRLGRVIYVSNSSVLMSHGLLIYIFLETHSSLWVASNSEKAIIVMSHTVLLPAYRYLPGQWVL